MIFKLRSTLTRDFPALKKITCQRCSSIFFSSFRDLKEDQTQIRFNLVVAIAIAQITFLAGIDATEVKVS